MDLREFRKRLEIIQEQSTKGTEQANASYQRLANEIEELNESVKRLLQIKSTTRAGSVTTQMEINIKGIKNQIASKQKEQAEIQEKIARIANTKTDFIAQIHQILEQMEEEQKSAEKELEEKKNSRRALKKAITRCKGTLRVLDEDPSLKKSDEVYLSSKEALDKCMAGKEELAKTIRSLQRRIKKLQNDHTELESFLMEVEGKKEVVQGNNEQDEERKMQEDEMWDAYNRELEEMQKNKQSQIDEAFEQKQTEEMKEEQKIEEETKKEVSESATISIPHIVPSSEVRTENSEAKKTEVREETKKEEAEPKVETKEKYKVQKVGLYIKDNQPVYYAVLTGTDGKEMHYESETIKGFNSIVPVSNEMEDTLSNKGINGAKRYYDIGLANFLREVDSKYATTGFMVYENMMKRKYELDKLESTLDIDYDFSALELTPKDKTNKAKIDYLMKVAKQNNILGVAKEYKKAPNRFKRWLNALKVKLLPVVEKTKEEKADSKKDDQKTSIEKLSEEFKTVRKEPNFDIEQWILDNGLSEKDAQVYRAIHNNLLKNEKFRRDLEPKTESSEKKETQKSEEKEPRKATLDEIGIAYKLTHEDANFDIEKFISDYELTNGEAQYFRTMYEKSKEPQKTSRRITIKPEVAKASTAKQEKSELPPLEINVDDYRTIWEPYKEEFKKEDFDVTKLELTDFEKQIVQTAYENWQQQQEAMKAYNANKAAKTSSKLFGKRSGASIGPRSDRNKVIRDSQISRDDGR